ncbi:sensor histidine kinase [Lachnotalea glycerini]|uniref:sensor histidine kinase n=1 Tax=Lachnotalea glycerini TaxID=1763509 RepID=UPI001472B5B2|nr:sensor histidine kinase [Lachnotalea glycerini]
MRKKENFQVSLDWKQYVLFYIVVVCLFFMLAPIQGLTQKYSSDQYINLSGLFVSIACIVLVIVTIWQGIIVNREIQLKELNKKNEEYIKLQKEYYENLLKQDEKMRRFHHDLNTHIMVIKAQCQNGDYNELEDYLKCIVEESGVFSVESYTGNKNVDAVLRQLFVQAKEQHIKIEIDGSLPIKTRISEFDLCTILSNLVTNAIEACEKINESSIRNIKILTNAYNEQIFISVKNTITGNIILKENHLITAKEDKKNHGIGSRNVENTVKKYDGIIVYQYKKTWFIAEVII